MPGAPAAALGAARPPAAGLRAWRGRSGPRPRAARRPAPALLAAASASADSARRRPPARWLARLAAALRAVLGARRRRGANAQGREAAQPPEGAFVPPGCDAEVEGEEEGLVAFEESLEEGFWCPDRLRGRSSEVVEEVNLWHYAMINDEGRSRFYWRALEGRVEGRRVLDIGAGSGLLSMMAAKLGAKEVIAVEANSDLAELATLNFQRNGLEDNIQVVHSLSTSLECEEEEMVDVIVSETLGTLLNGESTIDYLSDARARLALPGARVVPAGGRQCCVLVASPSLARVTGLQAAPEGVHGLDLSAMDCLKDTAQVISPNAWGLRLPDLPDLTLMSELVELYELDFASSTREDIPLERTYPLVALHDGVVDAVVASWEVWSDESRTNTISTHVGEPGGEQSSAWTMRDAHFSQALQLLEDGQEAASGKDSLPVPFKVAKGERLLLHVRHNQARTNVQFELRRAPE